MNAQFHDEFVRLSALFHTGELSEEEWALLQVHLAYCDSCRLAFDQFEQIAAGVFPAVAASRAVDLAEAPVESQASLAAAEARLMQRVEQVSTAQVADQRGKQNPRTLVLVGTLAAGVAVLITLGLMQYVQRVNDSGNTTQTASARRGDSRALETPPVQAPAASASRVITQTLPPAHPPASGHVATAEPGAANAALKRQLEADQSQRDQLIAERDDLARQVSAAQAQVAAMSSAAASSQEDQEKRAARLATLEASVRSLNVSLEETKSTLNDRDRMLALDKDFLSHDREIRDLIGARELYIADIFDVGKTGKTEKPFGRIFYTKDRSLVFYGYDLDKQANRKRAVSFQAWGSSEDDRTVSLGLFYQDEAQKNWVLRFDDTKTLARLNKVFVTAEPQGGSSKPSSKPLLMAYLQVQANHP